MTFAQQNIASSFELAQQLVRAKDVQEVLRLQSDYITKQMQVLSEQAREPGESTSQAAKDAAMPRAVTPAAVRAGVAAGQSSLRIAKSRRFQLTLIVHCSEILLHCTKAMLYCSISDGRRVL